MAESVLYSVNSNNTVYVDATPVTLSLNINCVAATATHTLAIKNGSTTLVTLSLGSYPAGSSTQSVSLTSVQRATILNSIPNVASFTATYVLSTTLNNVSQGTSSCTGTMAVNSHTSHPITNEFTYADTNPKTVAFTGDNQSVVVGISNIVLYNVSATAQNGASIKQYAISDNVYYNYKYYTSGGTINFGTIPKPIGFEDTTNKRLTVQGIDTRNFATQTFQTIPNVYSYDPLTVSSATLKRNSSDPSEIDISFNGTYTNKAQNAVTASYKFKETTASTYGSDNTVSVTVSGGNFSCSLSGVGSFAETTAYDVILTISDKITERTYSFVLAQENPLIAFRDNAIGIGGVPTGTNRVEIFSDYSLIANGKNNTFTYMPYSWSTNGGSSSSSGYARIATVTITGTYATAPITFEVSRRGDYRPVRLFLAFSGSSGTDPSLASFKYDSVSGTTNFAAFVYKTGTSVWDVYVRKTENADTIGVMTFVSSYMQARTTVSYASSIQSSVPAGATSATAI